MPAFFNRACSCALKGSAGLFIILVTASVACLTCCGLGGVAVPAPGAPAAGLAAACPAGGCCPAGAAG